MSDPQRSGSGSVEPSAKSADLDQRRKALEAQLDGVAERREPPPPSDATGRGRALGMALRIAADLLAALLVGGVLGWYLDAWLGTGPVLFLLFLALGAAAGMRNVFRYAYRMNRLAQGADHDAGRGSDETRRH